MEAINNLASAATKAIWGENSKGGAGTDPKESKEEPISGVQGDTSKGEPFGAGNMGEPTDAMAKKTGQEPGTEAGRVTGKETAAGSEEQSGKAHPSAAQNSSHMPGDSTKAQIDTRHPNDDQTSPGAAAEKMNVDNTAQPLDPKSLKGPGPKPLEQIAKEHGGDAGNTGKGNGNQGGASTLDSAKPTNDAKANGPKDEDADGQSGKPKREGTGELYVKSSGVQADGGDFDAANPGAGREADRILEEKGVHQNKSGDKTAGLSSGKDMSPSGKSSSPERKGVKGLGQKIKAKLHRKSEA